MDTGGIVGSTIGGIIALIAVGTIIFKIGDWRGRVNTDLSTLKQFMDEIRGDIKDILQRLPPPPVAGASPAKLTDFGDRLAAHMDAMQWAAGIAVELAPTLRGQEPYQVDQFAEAYVENSLSEEMKKTVARCAYEFGVGRVEPKAVLRVVLRDALLAAKPDA